MKQVATMYQIAAFGDFVNLQTNSENIRVLLDAFEDLGLVPTIPEPPPKGVFRLQLPGGLSSPKVIFRSSESPWVVQIADQRMDVISAKQGTDAEPADLGAVSDFIDRGVQIVGDVLARHPLKFSRISLVTRHSWIDWDPNGLSDYFRRFIQVPAFYYGSVPTEWSTRFVSQRELDSLPDEVINANTTLVRARLVTVPEPQAVTDGIECTIDLNTLPAREDPRFAIDDLKTFLAEMNDFEDILRKDLVGI